jgi:hypothetical protein
MSISWGLHDLWGSSLILYMWLSLMLRPVSMGSQDSVQELLGNRLTPSLLWGDFCSVNQCFPFILQETIYVKQKLEASNSNMTPKTTQVVPISTQQGWPWAKARWATALGLTSKLGLIQKKFKTLIERSQYIYIYKIKKAHILKTSL